MDCLMKRVFVGKLLMDFRCTGIPYREYFQIFYPIPAISPSSSDLQDFGKSYLSMHLAMHTIILWYSIPRDQQLGRQYRYPFSIQERQATKCYGWYSHGKLLDLTQKNDNLDFHKNSRHDSDFARKGYHRPILM